MPCIKNMNQATWASCFSLWNLAASFLPHYLSGMKTRSQNSQSRVSPTWDSGRYDPWCAVETKLLQRRCHCPRAWFRCPTHESPRCFSALILITSWYSCSLYFFPFPLMLFHSLWKEDSPQKVTTDKTFKSGVLQGRCANWGKPTLRSFLIVKWNEKYF